MKAFQEYAEPEDANPSSPQRRAPTAGEDETVVLPLGENTLTHNLGIPVLIVCTKVSQVRNTVESVPYTLVGPLFNFSTSTFFFLPSPDLFVIRQAQKAFSNVSIAALTAALLEHSP